MYVFVCIRIYYYISLYILIYPYILLYIIIYHYISLYIRIYYYILLYISLYIIIYYDYNIPKLFKKVFLEAFLAIDIMMLIFLSQKQTILELDLPV